MFENFGMYCIKQAFIQQHEWKNYFKSTETFNFDYILETDENKYNK